MNVFREKKKNITRVAVVCSEFVFYPCEVHMWLSQTFKAGCVYVCVYIFMS